MEVADVNIAIEYVMSWEDSRLSGVVTRSRDGKRTRFGIDEHWHPALTKTTFYTTMGVQQALEIARALYDLDYCQPLCIADMQNQDVANKVLSLGVNIGVIRAAKMLQDVLRVPGDGHIGPLTLHALECDNQEQVLDGLREDAKLYYEALVEQTPEDAVDLPGWLRRAKA